MVEKEVEADNLCGGGCECANALNSGGEDHYTKPPAPGQGELSKEITARVKYINQSLKVVDESLKGIIESVINYESPRCRD